MFLKTPSRDDRGSITAIEVIGIIPVTAIIAGAMFQLYLLGQAGVEAESAARLAARELSKGTAAGTAANRGEDQANPRFDVSVSTGSATADEPGTSGTVDSVSATAAATVPFLGIGIPGLDLTIERSATLPQDIGPAGF